MQTKKRESGKGKKTGARQRRGERGGREKKKRGEGKNKRIWVE